MEFEVNTWFGGIFCEEVETAIGGRRENRSPVCVLPPSGGLLTFESRRTMSGRKRRNTDAATVYTSKPQRKKGKTEAEGTEKPPKGKKQKKRQKPKNKGED